MGEKMINQKRAFSKNRVSTFNFFLFFVSIVFFNSCKEDPLLKRTYTPIPYESFRVVVKGKDNYTKELPSKPAIYASMQTSEGEILIELFDRDAPKTVQNFIDLAQGEKETISPKGEKQKKRFYDGLTFHRIIEGFMIQGGCPRGDGTGGPGYQFEDEINAVWLGLDKVTGEQIPFYDRYIQEVVLRNMAPKSREELESRMQEFDEKFKKAKKLPIIEVLYRIGYRYNEVLKSHKSTRGRIAMANAGPNTNGSQFFINQVDTPHLDGLHTVFGEVVRGMEVVDKIAKIGDKKKQTENSNPITIQQILILDRR